MGGRQGGAVKADAPHENISTNGRRNELEIMNMTKRATLPLLALAAAVCFGLTAHANTNDPTLSVYYNFDEEGDTIIDHSSYGNDGTISKGGSKREKSDRGGKALLFEQTRVDMNGPEFQNKPVDGITLACWVNHLGVGVQTLLDAIGDQHGSGLYHAEIRAAGFRWFHRDGNNTQIFNINPGPVLEANEWVHFAATYDSESGDVKTYVGGKETHSATGQGKLSDNWNVDAGIGDHKNDRWLTGLLDEYYLFSRALDEAEIQSVMNGEFLSVNPQGKTAVSWAGLKTRR